MKKIFFYLLLAILSLNACKTTKTETGNKNKETNYIIIDLEKQYSLNEKILVTIKNSSNNEVILLTPSLKHFQKYTDSGWKAVRVLNCPCDAPCRMPPEKKVLFSKQEIKLNWDQKESYCGKMTNTHIRETIYEYVKKGKYRFVVTIKNNNETKQIYKEFSIN